MRHEGVLFRFVLFSFIFFISIFNFFFFFSIFCLSLYGSQAFNQLFVLDPNNTST